MVGIYNRESNTIRTEVFNSRTAAAIKQMAEKNVPTGNTIYSDEATIYDKSLLAYKRGTINHWMKEWVRGEIHVNHVENFWSVMKRGIYGIYHQVSYKHLQLYCNEFAYRYNSRQLKDGERFELALQGIEGGLTYKRLVYGKGKESQSENKA